MVEARPWRDQERRGPKLSINADAQGGAGRASAKDDSARAGQRAIIPWLFHRNGKPITSFRVAWKKACKAAGIPGKIPHDFRRTAVRNLERAGVPRSAAMKMVGYKTQSIYQRYAIADEGMLKDAALKLGQLHEADRAQQKVAQFEKI